MSEAKWYVVHTYSGYENKVKANIEKAIENRNLADRILQVEVPTQSVVEVKGGASRETKKKLFPGYVMVYMVMDEDTWYIVRNTRGVTGFVGSDPKEPMPLSEDEMRFLGISDEEPEVRVDFKEGDRVVVRSGAWKETVGEISRLDVGKGTLTIMVPMFGRDTPVELGFAEVEKI